jgi:hypothetical protein
MAEEGFTTLRWKTLMIKTLSIVAVMTAALASPTFAQDASSPEKPAHALRHYQGTYNQVGVNGPSYVAPHAPDASSYFDHESWDRARIGDHDPDFSPSGS